jgi:hypothetical protein
MASKIGRAFKAFGEGFSRSAKSTAKKKEERLQAFRTPQSVSPETCWFCGRASINGCEAKVQMYCNERGGIGPGLHTWDQHWVPVPRCLRCQKGHTIVRQARLVGWFIEGVLVFLILPNALGHKPGDLTVMWLFFAWAAFGVLSHWLLSLPILYLLGIKPTSRAQYSPYVRNYGITANTGLLRYGTPANNWRPHDFMNRVSGGWVR